MPVDWTAKPEIYQEYQQLIALYNTQPSLRKGQLTAWPDDNVLLFEKHLEGDLRFLVAVNVRNAEQTVAVPDSWKDEDVSNLMTNEVVRLKQELKLAPFEYLILKNED